MRMILFALLLFFSLPESLYSQQDKRWALRVEGGRYEIHQDADGIGVGLKAVRKVTQGVLFVFGLTKGFGEVVFTSIEIDFEVQLSIHDKLSLVAGGGAGLMEERGSFETLALPYYATGGVEISVGTVDRIRLALRRGSHKAEGDSYSGPHLFTMGWVHYF